MKVNKLQALPKYLQTLDAAEEQQVKGGFGRIPGTRIPARTSRWDDIPFRIIRPRSGGSPKEATGTWTGLVKDSLFRP